MDAENRVVVLIDMDCFYCQVEEKLNPELKGKPIAVVQYNPWKGGGIIAVNYVARAMGVTRHMRGDEAKEKCPEIQLPSVPCQRGKADITKYRDAGKDVAKVLQKFTPLLERASIDEAYLDITAPVEERLKSLNIHTITPELTPNTYALGYDSLEDFIGDVHGYGCESIDFDHDHARRLLVGAVVVSEIRQAVYDQTGYRCSGGIAHNKILAKLVCGMNKPNKQTVLPKHSINILYKTLSVKKVKNMGGKFGDTVREVLKISKMAELQDFSEKELQAKFDERNGTWLYNIARGIDLEPVQARFNPKSIGCCKQLRGKSALLDLDSLKKWLKDLGDEIEDRLEKDAVESNRTPKQMVVSFSTQLGNGRDTSSSRSYNFVPDDELCGDTFAGKALELISDSLGIKSKDGETNLKLKSPIKFLGISVGKFEDNSDSKKTRKINDYFGTGQSNTNVIKDIKETSYSNTSKVDNQTPDEHKTIQNYERHVKNKQGKDYLLQKFFQVTDKSKDKEFIKGDKPTNNCLANVNDATDSGIIESTLDKQESFFAKFLTKDCKPKLLNIKEDIRPITPQCNIVHCGETEDSNDTFFSGSTINNEINKSIALFEDDPEEINRVSCIRDLLNKTEADVESPQSGSPVIRTPTPNGISNDLPKVEIPSPEKLETFECPECKKAILMTMIETHSDYHLALKLREEEREIVRKEITDRRENKKQMTERKEVKKQVTIKEDIKKRKVESNRSDTISSMTNFLVKIDDNIPTEICTECGKKVAVEKYMEHLDFHEAQKLNRILNKKSTTDIGNRNALKRTRKSISPLKKQKMPCHSRSIDSFFRS